MKSGNQIQIQHQELSFHGVIDLSELLGQRHAKKKSLVMILLKSGGKQFPTMCGALMVAPKPMP